MLDELRQAAARQRHARTLKALSLGSRRLLSEEGDMNAPFIFRSAKRGRSVDDYLALPQCQMPTIEETPREKLGEQPLVTRQSGEQNKGRYASRHDFFEPALNCAAKGGVCRCDTRRHMRHHAMLLIAYGATVSYEK